MHKHTNRLANETSPYLLQHAHNPVDWYPWGEEAFAKARSEDKPLFLSIGYSACHWCHVMERESFENEEIAAFLNAGFVSIKVDREERPDVDSIYMQAVQMMTGHGGWPMSMFLTPEGEPFYGGTYFPPQDRYGMPSFMTVLRHVSDAYRNRRSDVADASAEMRAVLNSVAAAPSGAEISHTLLHNLAARAADNFDRVHGGFGGAPKFPPSMSLEFLLQIAAATSDEALELIVDFTLRKMAEGGIYDQLGGGFHRYSVDARWLVPHFEKMLYDNALLTRLYVHAWQRGREPLFEKVARETIGFIQREMTSPEGGFYSTLDADSEGVEGKFYVWSRAEVEELIGDDAAIFCDLFDVTAHGNWEETNILHVVSSIAEVSKRHGVTLEQAHASIERAKERLFTHRATRIRPGRDEKILAGWNGWMLAAISEAAMAFDSSTFRELARRNAEFLLHKMFLDGRLQRSFKDGRARIPALLEDYAGVAWGLLAAFEALQDRRYLDRAAELADAILERFSDEASGGFYDTPTDHEKLIARPKDLMDNATPSGNSTAAEVLLKLSIYLGDEQYRIAAESAIRASLGLAQRYPSAFGYLLSAANYLAFGAKELVLTGRGEKRDALLRVISETYVPRRVLIASAQDDLPLAEGKPNDVARAYVCEGYRCEAPVDEPGELRKRL